MKDSFLTSTVLCTGNIWAGMCAFGGGVKTKDAFFDVGTFADVLCWKLSELPRIFERLFLKSFENIFFYFPYAAKGKELE